MRIKLSQRTQREAEERQAGAAETERRRAAEEKLNKQREQDATQERIRQLEQVKFGYDSNIFELNRLIRKLAADLEQHQGQDNEESRQERERTSWYTYFTRPLYGKEDETKEQKQEREIERLRRVAIKRIKENELNQKKARLHSFHSALDDVDSEIAAKKKRIEDEARTQTAKRQEQARKAEDARRRSEEQQERERQAKRKAAQAKLWREEAARAAKEAQEAREAQERARKAREAEAARRPSRTKPATTSKSTHRPRTSEKGSTCRHDAFWPRVEGSCLCSNCYAIQRRFAFQCPGCRMIACANCRQSLRGEKRKNYKDSRSRSEFDSNEYGYEDLYD